MTGCILLVLTLTFGFSGYLLPWNQLAFFATKVGTELIGSVPYIGPTLLRIVRGSEDVTGATLARFFGLHVAILPGIMTIVLALHLIFIQRQGISEPESWAHLPESQKRRMPFFPNFLLRDLILWLLVLNVLAILAVFFPAELGVKADPFAPAPPGIKPEWYFLFLYQTLKLLPARVLFMEGEFFGILMTTIGLIGWTLLPFWEPAIPRRYREPVRYALGGGLVLYIGTMTAWGYLS